MTAAMTKLLQRLMGTVDGNVQHPPSPFALIVTSADATAARRLEAIGVVRVEGTKAYRATLTAKTEKADTPTQVNEGDR